MYSHATRGGHDTITASIRPTTIFYHNNQYVHREYERIVGYIFGNMKIIYPISVSQLSIRNRQDSRLCDTII